MSVNYIKESFVKSFKSYKDMFKKNNIMVAGGVFTSLFTKQEINDLDCYVRNKQDLINFLKDCEDEGGCFINSITDKSMTIIGLVGLPPVQLIYSLPADNLQEVFKYFDFTINMAGYDFKDDSFVYHEDFFSGISQKRLSFNKDTAFPLISAMRVNKYKDRGYSISRSEMIKILLEVTKLKLDTKEEFISAVGGLYGNIILSSISSLEEFSIDKAMDIVEKEMKKQDKDIFTQFTPPEPTATCTVEDVIEMLEQNDPLNGGWVKEGDVAYYKEDAYTYLRHVPLVLAQLFAPSREVKLPEFSGGIYYKWVNTDLTSFHATYYQYKLFQECKPNNDYYLHLLTKEGLAKHHFASRGGVILACKVEKEGIHKAEGNELLVKSLVPMFIAEKSALDSLFDTPVIPTKDSVLKVTTVKAVGDKREEEGECGIPFGKIMSAVVPSQGPWNDDIDW